MQNMVHQQSQTPTRLRTLVRSNLCKQLGPGTDVLAKNIEVHMYNWALCVCDKHNMPRMWHEFLEQTYKGKVRTLLYNLKHSGDGGLLGAVRSGKVTPSSLLTMTHEQMQPDMWAGVHAELQRKEYEKFAPCLMNDCVGSGAFVCKRCHGDKTVYSQLQTRSADEPSTVYVKCLQCEATWKL